MNNSHDVAVAVATISKPLATLRTCKTITLENNLEFSNILKIKYNNNESEMNKNEELDFDRVVFLGLKEWKKEEIGYEIFHSGKPADRRVMKKLGRIAAELLKVNTYPKVDAVAIIPILNKALGIMDKRSLRDYRRTLLYYCNIDDGIIDRCVDSRLGELNVSGFVKRVPMEFVGSADK